MNAKKVIKELELEVTKCDREMARLSKRAADLERAIQLLGGHELARLRVTDVTCTPEKGAREFKLKQLPAARRGVTA